MTVRRRSAGCGRTSLRRRPTARWPISTTPRFASGKSPRSEVRPLWQALQDAGADVLLAGHEHNYERFAPQDVDARPSPSGIRQFVVGTGGKNFYSTTAVAPNSEVRRCDAYGVLLLTLKQGGYDWRFAGTRGEAVDAGSDSCTGASSPASPAPASPSTCATPDGAVRPEPTHGDRQRRRAGRGRTGHAVELHAYSQPSTTFRKVRDGRTDASGRAVFPVRPGTNTRLYAQHPGCPPGPSAVLDVRTSLSLTAQRIGSRDYVFASDSLPAPWWPHRQSVPGSARRQRGADRAGTRRRRERRVVAAPPVHRVGPLRCRRAHGAGPAERPRRQPRPLHAGLLNTPRLTCG